MLWMAMVYRQTGNYPETGFAEISSDAPAAGFGALAIHG